MVEKSTMAINGAIAGQDHRRSRSWAVALTLIAAGTLAAMVVMLQDQPSSVPTVLDADDDAFFDSSESVANGGDRDMQRSGQALKKGDLSEAFSLAKRAASEYSKSLSENRLDAAEKVESQVKAAIAAKHVANEDMIQGVLAEAQKVRAKAEASAEHEQASLKKAVTAAPSKVNAQQKGQLLRSAHPTHDFSLANQAHLLFRDEKLLNVHAAKLPALAETDPADPTKPVPKVLDCGPLSNDCNLNQGGEFYATKKHGAQTAKSVPKPTVSAPVSSTKASMVGATAKPDVKGRMAKLALLKHISQDHKQLDKSALNGSGSYSPAMQLLRDLSTGYLMPRAKSNDRFGRASQALHEESKQAFEDVGHCDKCFQDAWTARHSLQCAQTWCRLQQSEAVSLADVQPTKDVKDRLTVALLRLDEEQLHLNNQRAAVFSSFVGLDQGSTALKRVAVGHFLEQWVPKGSKAVQSWLKQEDAMNEGKAVLKANQLREVGAGKEGLTLEQALAPLNEQQQTINNHRQILVHAFLHKGSAFGDRKEYAKAQSVVLQWLPHASADVHSSSKQEKQHTAAAKPHEVHAVEQSKGVVPKLPAQQQHVAEEKTAHTEVNMAAEPEHEERAAPADTAAAVQQRPEVVARQARKPVVSAVHPVAVQAVKVVAAQKPVVNPAQTVAVQPVKAVAAHPQAGKMEQVKRGAENEALGGEAHAPHGDVMAVQDGRDKSASAKTTAEEAVHHGMPQYNAKKASEDMEGWFDDLVHKQIAVGHGVQTHAWDVKAAPTLEVSPKEKARQAEDQMIESHDSAKREGSSMEEAEEQAKKGMLVTKVGNELQHKSDQSARDEIENYFDHLSL